MTIFAIILSFALTGTIIYILLNRKLVLQQQISKPSPPMQPARSENITKEKFEAILSKNGRSMKGPAMVLTYPGFKVMTVGFIEDEVMLLASCVQDAACKHIGSTQLLEVSKIPQIVLIDKWEKTLSKTKGKWEISDIADGVTESGLVGYKSKIGHENEIFNDGSTAPKPVPSDPLPRKTNSEEEIVQGTFREVFNIYKEIESEAGCLNSQLNIFKQELESKGEEFWMSVYREWVIGQQKTIREWVLTSAYQLADIHFNTTGAYIYRGALSLSGLDAMKMCTVCLDMLVEANLISERDRQKMLNGINENVRMNG